MKTLAVLIDGQRFRDAAAPQGDASGFLEDLIVTDVSRVEVLRGSGSSLYGTNAIGGVINLVTDEGGGPFHECGPPRLISTLVFRK